MDYMNFLKERKSVRDFKDIELSPDQYSNIENAIAEVEEMGAREFVKFYIVEDPDHFYNLMDGKAGYAGVMVKAPMYIAMEYKEESLMTLLEGAVFMEELITKIQAMGLGSTWITLGAATEKEKQEVFGLVADNVSYVLAVGEPKGKKLFDKPVTSTRMDVDELVFTDRTFETPATEEIKNYSMRDLFDALRYAPSHKNLQPWRFVLNDGTLTLYLVSGDNLNWTLTAGGIVMYYFQRLAERMGLNSTWEIDIVDEGDYLKVATFDL